MYACIQGLVFFKLIFSKVNMMKLFHSIIILYWRSKVVFKWNLLHKEIWYFRVICFCTDNNLKQNHLSMFLCITIFHPNIHNIGIMSNKYNKNKGYRLELSVFLSNHYIGVNIHCYLKCCPNCLKQYPINFELTLNTCSFNTYNVDFCQFKFWEYSPKNV